MSALTRVALLVALLLAVACADTDSGPSGPSTVVLNLVYVPPAKPATCPSPDMALCFTGCSHHYAPANLRVSGSWGEGERLSVCGEAYCATLTGAPVGHELTVLLIDIEQCCRDCTAAVRETVFANGTRLMRFVEGQGGQAGGLALTIDGDGRVTP